MRTHLKLWTVAMAATLALTACAAEDEAPVENEPSQESTADFELTLQSEPSQLILADADGHPVGALIEYEFYELGGVPEEVADSYAAAVKSYKVTFIGQVQDELAKLSADDFEALDGTEADECGGMPCAVRIEIGQSEPEASDGELRTEFNGSVEHNSQAPEIEDAFAPLKGAQEFGLDLETGEHAASDKRS